MVPFHLRGPNDKTFPVTGVVDSGADLSLFPIAWAEPLGIKVADCQIIEGGSAAGPGEYHLWKEPLAATLLGQTIDLVAIFGSSSDTLLGREDFFIHFDVRIDQKETHFFLTPYEGA